MFKVLLDWIIKFVICAFNMITYLENKWATTEVSAGFSKRSGEILKDASGALDGWVIRIVRPVWKDRSNTPVRLSSMKGWYALNIQCIVIDKKGYSGHITCIRVYLMTLVISKKEFCIRSYLGFKTNYLSFDSLSLAIQHIQQDLFHLFCIKYHLTVPLKRILISTTLGKNNNWACFWERLIYAEVFWGSSNLIPRAWIFESWRCNSATQIFSSILQSNKYSFDTTVDKQIFELHCDGTGANYMMLGNDVWNIMGSPSTNGKMKIRFGRLWHSHGYA